VLLKDTLYRKESFASKESDTKILQSTYFAYKVGIIRSYSNRICYWKTTKRRPKDAWELHAALEQYLRSIVSTSNTTEPAGYDVTALAIITPKKIKGLQIHLLQCGVVTLTIAFSVLYRTHVSLFGKTVCIVYVCLISLCFTKVNVLWPLSAYALLPPRICPRLLSSICAFLVTAMHVVYSFACGSDDLTPGLSNLFSIAGHFHMRKFIAGHKRFAT